MIRTIPLFLLLPLLLLPVPVSAGEANVFVYHRFGDSRHPSTNISLETFAEQLKLLKEGRYEVLPLGEIVRRMKAGEPLPDRCVALTVDDGYKTFLSGAMPLLRRYGFPATLFVNTDSVGRPSYLDWEELRGLAAEGVEIGNHSSAHLYMIERLPGEDEARWEKRTREDIVAAQAKLEAELGRAPELFAYPYGEYSPRLMEIVKEAGFLGAAAQQSGVVHSGGDLFALPRFPMGGPFGTLQGFREKVGMKALPVKVVSPLSPVLSGDDPPTLVVDIAEDGIDLSRLRCFVQGQAQGRVTADPLVAGRFIVRAESPLGGRRSKYTLTAPSRNGRQWYWFSQLWVTPGRAE